MPVFRSSLGTAGFNDHLRRLHPPIAEDDFEPFAKSQRLCFQDWLPIISYAPSFSSSESWRLPFELPTDLSRWPACGSSPSCRNGHFSIRHASFHALPVSP